MSDVVIRCPNCGTTQRALGECDACHDADVRYFCPNHTPGRWLDSPACTGCGARVERERASRRTPPPRRPATSLPAPAPAPAPPRREASRPPVAPRPTRVPVRRARVDVDHGHDTADRVAAPPALRMRLAPGLGCVGRLALLLTLVAVLFTVIPVVALAVLGGPVREWVVDAGQRFGVVEGGIPIQTRRGIDAYHAGDLARAERELREAAWAYRRSAVALLYLARMRMDAGDLERGGEYLREAVAREPDNSLAHRELAGYHLTRARRLLANRAGGEGSTEAPYARDELRKAAQHYARAVALDPTDRRAQGYYACVLTDLGEAADAERLLEQAGSGPWDECARPAGRERGRAR